VAARSADRRLPRYGLHPPKRPIWTVLYQGLCVGIRDTGDMLCGGGTAPVFPSLFVKFLKTGIRTTTAVPCPGLPANFSETLIQYARWRVNQMARDCS
jgi:hypothetical protein